MFYHKNPPAPTTNHVCCGRQQVKRGMWTPDEDEKLVSYIAAHGLGCWSTLPTLAGLQRCGKSCRLRWINYLRPDLKRGNFTAREASLIIELHEMLGNKWAQIARHLPGRTDNEVKNFWNANIKRGRLFQAQRTLVSPDPRLFSGNSPNTDAPAPPPNPNQLEMDNYSVALMPSTSAGLPPLPVSRAVENPEVVVDRSYQSDEFGLDHGDPDMDFLNALISEGGSFWPETVAADFGALLESGSFSASNWGPHT